MKLVLIAFIILLVVILYLLKSSPEPLTISQPFLYPTSREHWDGAHGGMHKHLTDSSYTTFDLRYKVTPINTVVPGKLVEFNCKELSSAAAAIAKASKQNQKELSLAVNKYTRDTQHRSVVGGGGTPPYSAGKIRVSGGHHTFNDISITKDTMIRTFNLKNVLDIDRKNKTITVESGILLEDLNLCLKDNNLALHILPAIPYQSLGGVVATSSHGSRWNMGSMSSAVLEMTLVLANGMIKTFKHGDPEFPAVQVNLGCLGVIYSVKMQCVDLFAVEHRRVKSTWPQVLPNIGDYLQKDIFWQCYIRPDSKKLSTTMYLRSLVPLVRGSRESSEFTTKGSQSDPESAPASDGGLPTDELNDFTGELGKNRDKSVKKVNKKIDYGMYVLTKNEEAAYYTESEVGVPVEMLQPAVEDVLAVIDSYKKKNKGWKYGKPILIRFTGADSSYLSMTAGRDTVFINIFQDAKVATDPITMGLFRDFQNVLVEKYNGRPHWGKYNELTPQIVRQVYGYQAVDSFNAVRNALDPNRIFSNDYIDRALGN